MARQTISVSDIPLVPQSFWCLHVTDFTSVETPHGVLVGADGTRLNSLRQQLLKRCQMQQLEVIVVEHASTETMRHSFLKRPTAVDWLVQNSQLSRLAAAGAIRDLPLQVAPELCSNARNPTQFLGLAAAIANQPDVIVYSTSGMDPRGVSLMHEYAPRRYTKGCLIHLSTRELKGDLCAHSGDCLVIDTNETNLEL